MAFFFCAVQMQLFDVQYKHRITGLTENEMATKQDEKRTARIEMRVTPAVKLDAEKKAFCAGVKLTEWIEKLIKAAK